MQANSFVEFDKVFPLGVELTVGYLLDARFSCLTGVTEPEGWRPDMKGTKPGVEACPCSDGHTFDR